MDSCYSQQGMPVLSGFLATFLVKGVDSFDKVVAGYGLLDILEDLWGIL